MSPAQRRVTRAVIFLSGAMLMATEIAAFRIIGKSFGSALRETTAVIAVFLAAMSVGYWAGGRAGDRWPQTTTLIAALLCAAAALFAIPWLDSIVSLAVERSTIPIALHAFLATTITFAVPAAFFASVSPIAVRLFIKSTAEGGSTSGSISAISTVGSIAGSIGTAFFLLEWLESINRTVIFIGVISCATAAMLLFVTERDGRLPLRRYALATVIGAAMILVPLFAFVRSTRLDASLLQQAPGWKVLFAGDSPYHHVTVREYRSKRRILSFGLGEQSTMEVGDPFGPGAPYSSSLHLGRLIRPDTHRVLVIGLGGGTAAKQFTHDYPDVTVDAVEVDPMVVSVAKRFFDVTPSDRLRIDTADGRQFLRRTNERWDLIIVDAYTTNQYGATVPPHLVTREFFIEAAAHLTPAGIVHFHCAFSGTRILPALQKTMASVFPSTVISGGEILGSIAPILVSRQLLTERALRSPAARLPNLMTYVSELHPVTPAAPDVPLLTDDYAPVDALLRQK